MNEADEIENAGDSGGITFRLTSTPINAAFLEEILLGSSLAARAGSLHVEGCSPTRSAEVHYQMVRMTLKRAIDTLESALATWTKL